MAISDDFSRFYILKDDSENVGLAFDATDASKAKKVTISDDYVKLSFDATAYSKVVTIDGSTRTSRIDITGNSNNNSILGGSSSESLNGGAGNDVLTGGGGADTFVGSLGKNTITDYNPTQGDVIKLASGVYPTKAAVSKNNVVFTFSDKSTMTLTNAKGVPLNVVDFDGNPVYTLSQPFGDTILSASSDTKVLNASLNTLVKTIDASSATASEGISIVGNTAANSIKGSDFTNNTITAGAGNDTLTGGTGTGVVNTYIFSEGQGNNIITNFKFGTAGDRILVKTGKIIGHTVKNDDIIIALALNGKKTTNITVEGGRNQYITVLKPNGAIDTGNTIIYRDSTDYIVTDETIVNPSITGDTAKLIDASTEEYVLTRGTYITGNSTANTIKGSKYNDTLSGGAGKDTLIGGEGSDIFIYAAGDGVEVINDFDSGTDVIRLANPDTTITTSVLNTAKGANDVVFTIATTDGKNKGTLTVNDTGSQLITLERASVEGGTVANNGVETIAAQKYGVDKLVVDVDVAPVDFTHIENAGYVNQKTVTDIRVINTSYNSKVVTIDGSSAQDGKLYIIGNTGKNSIVGSTTGPNTIQGGQGNDTMQGATGYEDIFIFDSVDGTDAIIGFESDTDVIKLSSDDVKITAASLVTAKGANDVQLTIGKTKVVVKGVADTVASVNAKGKAVTEYIPQKLTFEKGDGSRYKMTYGGTLAKVEDGDITVGGTLDFSANTNIATIDAGGIILDGATTDTIDGVEVLVAASSTVARKESVHIIGSAKANTIISATNGDPHSNNDVITTTVTGGAGNDVFILASGGDMLITDYNTNAKGEADKIRLLENQSVVDGVSIAGSEGDLLLTVSTKITTIEGMSTVESSYDNVITIAGGADSIITVVDSNGNESKQKYGASVIVIDDSSSQNIIAGSQVTAVENNGRKKAINIISTGDNAISIEAGTGNDTLNGGPSTGGVATLTGGDGKDIFYHNSGKFAEIITDYETGKDKLEFVEGMEIASIAQSGNDGSDVVLHFTTVTKVDGRTNIYGDGDITILGGYGKKISIVKEATEELTTTKNGVTTTTTKLVKNESAQIYGASELYILDADGATVDASDGANKGYVELVDASARTAKKPVVIKGNATSATSLNQHVYVNNNTLIGGKGNDTLYTGESGTTELTGGAGADVFVYNGGNVTITDYAWNKKDANCDKILILNTAFSSIPDVFSPTVASHYDNEDVIFTFNSSNTLTIKNAKGSNIAIIDGDGSTISSTDAYLNPHEWIIDNKTTPTTLKAVYIDGKGTKYNAISASNRSSASTIEGSKADTEYIITGGKGADYIIGNGAANTISSGKGNDTIKANGGGNNKELTDSTAKFNVLTGGDGNDVFYFNPSTTNSNERGTEYSIITDYQVGKDSIKLAEGLHVYQASTTNSRATLISSTGQATLTGVQATVNAGVVEVVKNGNKTIAKTTTTTPSDVKLTIVDDENYIRGEITIWDAGGYSEIVDTSAGVSVAAIAPYKITVAEESTNAKGKTVVNSSALDYVSSEIVVVNADGTTIDASPNVSVVNITASQVKPIRTTAMYVIGNAHANSITGTEKADTLMGGGASNGVDTLVGRTGNDYFILDGKGDVIIADYKSEKSNYDRIQLAEDVILSDGTASGNDLIMTYKLGTESNATEYHATIVGAASTKITLAGSDGKAGAQVYGQENITVANTDGDKVDVTSNKSVKSIDASKRTKNVGLVGNTITSTILGGSKNDTIDVSALVITDTIKGAYIDAGAGNDEIFGSTGADNIILGAGNDTFYTGGGDDTVVTGAGKDLILYQGDNGGIVTITDYDPKNDRIELNATTLVGHTTYDISMLNYSIGTDTTTVILNLGYVINPNGSNIMNTTIDSAKIILPNSVDKKLLITDAQGTTDTITLSDPNVRKVTNSDGSNIEPTSGSGSTIKTIDATARSTPVTLTGSIDTTYIKGGKNNDTIVLNSSSPGGTIQGGKGNDVMTGVAGKTFYAYTNGDGKDTITNYADGDMIVLETAATKVTEAKSSVTGSDYLLTIGSGSILIKGAANKAIKVLSYGATDATTYNSQTNTTTNSSQTSSRNFIELLEDDNIAFGNSELSEILNPEYQVNAELRMQNADLREINSALETGTQLNTNTIYKQKSNLTAK